MFEKEKQFQPPISKRIHLQKCMLLTRVLHRAYSLSGWCLRAPRLHVSQLLLALNISQVGFPGFVICVVVKWSVWELNGSAVSQSVSVRGGAGGGWGAVTLLSLGLVSLMKISEWSLISFPPCKLPGVLL